MWSTLEVDRLTALEKEWGEEPTVDRMLAQFFGVEKKNGSSKKKKGNLADLAMQFSDGVID